MSVQPPRQFNLRSVLTRNRRAQLGHSRSNKEKTFPCTSRNDTKTWNYVYQYQNRYLPFRHWSRRTIATWQYYSGLVFSWFGVHDSEINKIMLPSMVEIVSAFYEASWCVITLRNFIYPRKRFQWCEKWTWKLYYLKSFVLQYFLDSYKLRGLTHPSLIHHSEWPIPNNFRVSITDLLRPIRKRTCSCYHCCEFTSIFIP